MHTRATYIGINSIIYKHNRQTKEEENVYPKCKSLRAHNKSSLVLGPSPTFCQGRTWGQAVCQMTGTPSMLASS